MKGWMNVYRWKLETVNPSKTASCNLPGHIGTEWDIE